MSTGTVVGFKDEQGYGFIRPDDGGGDVFVHARNITILSMKGLWRFVVPGLGKEAEQPHNNGY
jgi:cold shock CspA family protein